MLDPRFAHQMAAQKNFFARLEARAKAASRSKRVPLILVFLLFHAGDTPLELDGHVAFVKRKDVLTALCLVNMRVSRNGLDELLHRLEEAGLVELKGRKVRLSRAFVEDLASAAQQVN